MKQILFEISSQDFSSQFFNHSPGVWAKCLYNSVTSITDAFGTTATIEYQFTNLQNVSGVKVDKVSYDMAESLSDCEDNENLFYYDYSTQILYIHFENNSRQLSKEILIGLIFGYSDINNKVTKNIYNQSYYKPKLISVSNIKKEIDPSFYGRAKYPATNVTLSNLDEEFDTWRERNLWGTSARFLYADDPTTYSDFRQIYNGFIADDSADWETFTVDLDDERKKLEQSIATNLITLADYPNAPDGSINLVKPVVYGKVFKQKAICIDESAASKQFLFVDTLYNSPVSVEGIYIDGVAQSEDSLSLFDGTFYLTTTDIDNVYVSFTMPIVNGVSIILDLMENYDNKKFLSTYYDVYEIYRAINMSRNTSVYVDDDKKLKDIIEQICVDCGIRYFYTDAGKIIMRTYDENRETTATLRYDDWLNDPTRSNNGSEYLTQCTIKWMKEGDSDEYKRQYVNRDYETEAYNTYKKLKPKTFETGLYEESAAIEKSEEIMKYSSNITDIFTRDCRWDFNNSIELTDFILCAPFTRVKDVLSEVLAVHEVIGIQKNLKDRKITLTLRYVKPAPIYIQGNSFTDGLYAVTQDTDGLEIQVPMSDTTQEEV